MALFLSLLALAAMAATLFILIRGLVNMAGTTSADEQGDGPSERALRSQKLMRSRILFQAIAIGILALLLIVAGANSH